MLTGPTTRAWLLAVAAAVLFSAIQTLQVVLRVPYVPLWLLFAYELPVWLWWVATSPVIFRIARRYPLTGRNWHWHFLPHMFAAIAVAPLMVGTVNVVRSLMYMLVVPTGVVSDPRVLEYLAMAPFLEEFVISWRLYFSFLILVYFAIVGVGHLVDFQRLAQIKSLRESELEASLSRSELELLRTQIQPHFLFNTLNTISGLMSKDIDLARQVLTNLAELLRASLRSNDEHETILSEELQGLEAYLSIVDARFGDHLRIFMLVEPDTRRALVPRMLFQPLVENSIRHGMTESDDPLMIVLRARRDGPNLLLAVEDNGRGLAAGRKMEEGIGLGNTRRRLEQLYAGKASITLTTPAAGGFGVSVRLPLRIRGGSQAETRTDHHGTAA